RRDPVVRPAGILESAGLLKSKGVASRYTVEMEARRTISVRRAVAVALGVGLFSVLVPIGVQAVTSSVTISDAKNFSSKARVLKGELQVGGGPLTVIPAAPKVPLWGVAHVTDTNRHQTLAGPFSSSNVFHITSLTFGNVGT